MIARRPKVPWEQITGGWEKRTGEYRELANGSTRCFRSDRVSGRVAEEAAPTAISAKQPPTVPPRSWEPGRGCEPRTYLPGVGGAAAADPGGGRGIFQRQGFGGADYRDGTDGELLQQGARRTVGSDFRAAPERVPAYSRAARPNVARRSVGPARLHAWGRARTAVTDRRHPPPPRLSDRRGYG